MFCMGLLSVLQRVGWRLVRVVHNSRNVDSENDGRVKSGD